MCRKQASCLAGGRTQLVERLKKIDELSGWVLGECKARQQERGCVIYEARDREGRGHWLLAGPWREWQRVASLWGHLRWVNRMISDSSHIFRFMEDMLPQVTWKAVGEGYIGYSEKRAAKPFLETVSAATPPRFENLVQLTGFLRLLQTGENSFRSGESQTILAGMEGRAERTIQAVAERIPPKPAYRNWRSFYLQNARAIRRSSNYHLTLSLGSFATKCFSSTDRGALLVEFPFFLCEDIADTDLCRLLHYLLDASVQDRQYLVDLYFNMRIPSHFFTLFAHYSMMSTLRDLLKSEKGSDSERACLDQFAKLARQHDLFRTPVPVWYA